MKSCPRKVHKSVAAIGRKVPVEGGTRQQISHAALLQFQSQERGSADSLVGLRSRSRLPGLIRTGKLRERFSPFGSVRFRTENTKRKGFHPSFS
jgi:hypothetical protein